jgi:outer membrane protein assembly factor BamB
MYRLRTVALLIVLAAALPVWAGNWPQWRGPTGNSVTLETGLPVKWGETENVVWKCPLPDGASTPAVWGDAIFATGQDGETLLLMRIDKASGKVVWKQQVGSGSVERTAPPRGAGGNPRQKFHRLHNLASPSPVTDGEVVVAHYGNGDLTAYDFAGKQLWRHNLQADYGRYTIWWGHANSPVLYRDLVICVCMQDSLVDLGLPRAESYLAAYDKRTGELRWKTPRQTQATAEQCDAYTTPVFRTANGREELVVMGGNQLDAYDPATGKQLWALPGLTGNRTITGPTLADGRIYTTIGMRGALLCVRPPEDGSAPEVAWRHAQSTPDTPCPVVSNGLVFTVSDNGIAQCFDEKSGQLHWQERLPTGDHKASPLAAEGRVYFVGLKGRTTVVAAAAKFERLAENRLDDELIASPAVADGKLYLRGRKALYCLGGK